MNYTTAHSKGVPNSFDSNSRSAPLASKMSIIFVSLFAAAKCIT